MVYTTLEIKSYRDKSERKYNIYFKTQLKEVYVKNDLQVKGCLALTLSSRHPVRRRGVLEE